MVQTRSARAAADQLAPAARLPSDVLERILREVGETLKTQVPSCGDWGPDRGKRHFHASWRWQEAALVKLALVHSTWRPVVERLLIETISLHSAVKARKLLETDQLDRYQAWSVSLGSGHKAKRVEPGLVSELLSRVGPIDSLTVGLCPGLNRNVLLASTGWLTNLTRLDLSCTVHGLRKRDNPLPCPSRIPLTHLTLGDYSIDPAFLNDLITASLDTLAFLDLTINPRNLAAVSAAFPLVSPSLPHLRLAFHQPAEWSPFLPFLRGCTGVRWLSLTGGTLAGVQAVLAALPEGGRKVEGLEVSWYTIKGADAEAMLDKPALGGLRTLRVMHVGGWAMPRFEEMGRACRARRVVLLE